MLSINPDESTALRLIAFLAIVAIVLAWETLRPRRQSAYSKPIRWLNNFSISTLNSVILAAVFPLLAVAAAVLAQEKHWGLFNWWQLPGWLSVVLFVLLFDLAIYWQHRLYHWLPFLWPLHRMHHADPDFDASTGIRFHPVSIVLSMLIKILIVLALGPPAIAVLLAEVILNVTSVFNHGNIYISPRIDRLLRRVLVTPDMHRIHHSTADSEMNCNFGFNFPWWDRLFGSYCEQPQAGHEEMTVGVPAYPGSGELWLHRLLSHPFRSG